MTPSDGTSPEPPASAPAAAERPRLRDDIDARPAGARAPGLFVLFDATGLSPARLAATRQTLRVVARLDGARTLLDLHDLFRQTAARNGDDADAAEPAPASDELLAIIDALDEALFLDNARFAEYRARRTETFAAEPLRAAASAGTAYPDDGEALREALRRWMADAPPPEETPTAGAGGPLRPWRAPRGVIAPHIDFARGWAGYGQVYRELSRRRPPAIVYVVGVAHRPLTSCCAICAKDFATPLGILAHDAAACRGLASAGRAVGVDWTAESTAHLTEHSVELQAVWLKAVWPSTRIVPLLVSCRPAPEPPAAGEAPLLFDDPADAAEWDALGGELSRAASVDGGGGATILASADLAHVGPCFDPDDPELTGDRLSEVETADRAYLALAAAGDARGAWRWLRERGRRQRICGGAAIHALGRALPGARGRLLGYHQAADEEGGQAVTFAGMLFE